MKNKVYTIGRDATCDIVINDPTDVVSRVHASLKSKGNGKYVLIDQSTNGTYVNGIRMSANEEVPVSRKDVITLAHTSTLDWNQIPNEKDPKLMWIIIAIAVVAIAGICYFAFCGKEDAQEQTQTEETVVTPVTFEPPIEKKDSTAKETIYLKPKQVVKPEPKKPEEVKPEPKQEEPEVVNPIL